MNYEYIRNVRAPSVPMERLYNEIKTTISFVCDGRNCRLETAQDIHNRVMNRLNDWGKFLESKKKSIVECLIHQIEQDDVILTFGESERITEALVGAALQKPFRQFRVVVVGGRPKQNNENMLRKLCPAPCSLHTGTSECASIYHGNNHKSYCICFCDVGQWLGCCRYWHGRSGRDD